MRRSTANAAALLLLYLLCAASVPAAAKPPDDGGPALNAQAVLVLNNKSGKVLLDRQANAVRSIASLTKLQAALVFMDRGLKLEEGTVITRDDWKVALNGCRTRLELNWTYSNGDLLHAALMASDNRSVSALGRAVGLSANALVQAMNERARKMGLTKTNFLGPVGIEHGNVSTAWELSRIVRDASKNEALRTIMGKNGHMVKPLRGYLKVWYTNTNPLVGAKGLTFLATKTGYNASAGYSLATVLRTQDLGEITVVLLGCKKKHQRVTDLKQILSWLRAGGRQKAA
jgi:serine-type D-Ala-D-Ala endopeptidase (penicillin-binding protein 7)